MSKTPALVWFKRLATVAGPFEGHDNGNVGSAFRSNPTDGTDPRERHALPGARKRLLRFCTQHPGDVLFIPGHISHAVQNLKPSAGVAVEFYAPSL